MPDDSLEILVKMTGDTSGGQLVKKELQETKAEITDGLDPAVAHYGAQTEAATKSVEGMGVSHREMTKALGLLGPEFAHVGHLAMAAFSNPLMLAIIAVAAALKAMDAAMKKGIERDTSLLGITSVAPKMEKFSQVLSGAKAALLDFFAAASKGADAEEKLGDATARATALAKAQAEATQAQDDAEKELAMALLEKDKASGKITEEQYEQKKAGIEDEAELRKVKRDKDAREQSIKGHWKQIDDLNKLADESEAKVKPLAAASEESNRAATANQERIDAARANEAKYKAAKGLSYDEMQARRANMSALGTFEGLQPELKAKADQDKKALEQAQNKTLADRNAARELKARTITESQEADIKNPAEQRAAETRIRARGVKGEAKSEEELFKGPEATLVRGVSQAEEARAHGQKLTVTQQSQEQVLKQMLAAHGASAQAHLEALKAAHGSIEKLHTEQQQILRLLKEQNRRVTHAQNP